MSGLFSELKRRNVFRVGIAYIMLGWVVIQVTDVVVPALNLPNVLNTIVVYIGLVGFPFALFFAWAFELTPDGVVRSEDVTVEDSQTNETGRKLEHIAVGLLVIAVGLLVWDGYLRDNDGSTEGTTAAASKSIAVLPFVNMSTDPEQEFFSDGIAEEILNVLAKIEGLHVTSRSSAFSFKGKDFSIPEVAKALGVSTVLEGSVRKSGTRVRITAQLIQADGDKHLWSETYDRELDDIFAIQDEISEAIVGQLRTHLGLSENAQLAAQVGLSQNTEAYEAYLKGRQALLLRTNESINAAVRNFEYALSLDPDFALAHAELAIAHMLLTREQYGPKLFEEVQLLARPHAERAMELAPENPDVLAAAGFIDWNLYAPPETIKYFEEGLKRNPNHAGLLNWLAIIDEERGEHKKALDRRLKLLALDPLGAINLNNLGLSYRYALSDEEFTNILDKLKALFPSGYYQSLASDYYYKGQFVEGTKANFDGALVDPKSGLAKQFAGYSLAYFGLYDEAIVLGPSISDSFMKLAENYQGIIDAHANKLGALNEEEKKALGLAYAALGDYDTALPILEEAWIDVEGRAVIGGLATGFSYREAFALVTARRNANPDADVSDVRAALLDDLRRGREVNFEEQFVKQTEAALSMLDGDYKTAAQHISSSLEEFPRLLPRNEDFYSELYKQAEYITAMDDADGKIKVFRDEFLGEVCKENPYEIYWTPLPETCAGYN